MEERKRTGFLDSLRTQKGYKRSGLRNLRLCLWITACHSLLLGTLIVLFTEKFYRLFFGIEVDNVFFVKQAGVFLFCLGMFYLIPLQDISRQDRTLCTIIATKVLAVLFLLANFELMARPFVIMLAAGGDAVMALSLLFFRWKTLQQNL